MKQIPEFPNYFITNTGRVWSNRYKRWLKASISNNGYDRIHLGKSSNKSIHRLVLESFVGPCPDGMECRHKDGNKLNNNLENLRWGTKSENSLDTIKHHTHPTAKLNKNDVIEIKKLLKLGLNQVIIAKLFEVSSSLISYINTGKIWNYVKSED